MVGGEVNFKPVLQDFLSICEITMSFKTKITRLTQNADKFHPFLISLQGQFNHDF